MTDAHTALIARDLTRSYNGRRVIDEVSMTLNSGEVTALVGKSGAGKTTLLRLLAGMERPDSGQVSSGETILSGPSTYIPIEKRKIGLVFQDFALFPHLNVIKNVAFGLNKLRKDERYAIAEQWIAKLGLTHRKDAYPHQLSGGEQQRVAIARALAPEPVAMLLDEPFSGLDPTMREHVRHVALEAIRAAGVPSLLVTHDASEALVHADKIAIIDNGKILQEASPDMAYSQPNCVESARALGPLHKIDPRHLPEAWRSSPETKQLYYRPEALQIDPKSQIKLQLTRWRLAGALTEMTLIHNGVELFMAARPTVNLRIGEMVPVSLDQKLVFRFRD